jgi:beta-glucanase (GH16 family)
MNKSRPVSSLPFDKGASVAPRRRTTIQTRSVVARLAMMGALGTVAAVLAHATASAAVLTGSDEFNGPAGSAPNPAIWGYDLGGGGWGNNELQTYTNSTKNASMDGKGHLAITAIKTSTGYTSARLTTNGKFAFTYGRVEASIKMPAGAGMDSAFWTLGSNLYTVGWPQTGEIDMAEYLGNGGTYHVGLHGPPNWQLGVDPSIGTSLSAGFHTYWVDKEPGQITVGIDGITEGTATRASLPAGDQWVFDAPTNLLLDVAVGGNYPGSPPPSTKFPATMLVDYVRYYASTGAGAQPAAVSASQVSPQPIASPPPSGPMAALGALAALAQGAIQALVTTPMTALSNFVAAMGTPSAAHTAPAVTATTMAAPTTTGLLSNVDAPAVKATQPTTQTPAAPAVTPSLVASPKATALSAAPTALPAATPASAAAAPTSAPNATAAVKAPKVTRARSRAAAAASATPAAAVPAAAIASATAPATAPKAASEAVPHATDSPDK